MNTDSYIDNSSNAEKKVKASALTVTADNTSEIDTDAGAASLAAGFGSGGIAGTMAWR
ncbi:hypothetical protein [Vibrio taketomensis]|uniref:hypothetical protein n=1 Tax=Vibrio taketomensis TaxID=2572923 RepID=UPI00138A48A8|nr:hypothetical protein [Vibrio taketomensis]